MRKVCVVVGSRANYGSIKSVMRAVKAHPDLELQIIVGASALLDRFGSVVDIIERDGFVVNARVNMIVEGETPVTMAKSTGLGLLELPTLFELLKPDVVVTVGDRFETMATAVAGAYMNIPLAHTMGGEVTGTIDESIRHAVTKFAHIHFPACSEAAERIVKLGEPPETVFNVGCPRIDLVAEVLRQGDNGSLEGLFEVGVGVELDLDRPFAIVSQHPITTEYGHGEDQITETLMAVREVGIPAVVLWPNADAGSEEIARGIRKLRERGLDNEMHFFKNLHTETYIRLMARTACLLGNSSSAIREGAFIGTPAVNIGSRQTGRQRGANVTDVGHSRDEVVAALERQLEHGRYDSEPIYGDGGAGKRIADVLATVEPSIQKRITY